MNIDLPLSPHLEQFVREQLARGHFRTESDVIRAALQLLAVQSQGEFPARHQHDSAQTSIGSGSKLHAPASHELSGRPDVSPSSGRRSPRGLLADIASHITPEDIKAARREMWTRFPNDEAR